MKISAKWLGLYVDLEGVDIDDLFNQFTMTTAEVEGIERLGSELQKLVVARVEDVQPHPDADKLSVTQVFDGEKTSQVVCGANNVRKGMYTILAQPGAKFGDFKIKKSKLRGVKSEGMLCSSDEVGAGEANGGILDLDEITPGTPVAQALGIDDAIIEIDNKSLTHRPDLWGHYGLAREVSAIIKRPLKTPVKPLPEGGTGVEFKVEVHAKDLCPRYMATVIENITVKPSPEWLQQLLNAVGLRPINNIVDITNFVMSEIAQPLHAFDLSKIEGNQINVRRAKAGETLCLLADQQKVYLTEEMCVIADANKPIALAGIMGGDNSKIDDNTTSIVLEGAAFDFINNRRTSTALNIRTDSSMRYEKSLDTNYVPQAVSRFLELLKQSCPDMQISSQIFDVNNVDRQDIEIDLDLDWVRIKLGAELSNETIVSILTNLEFEITGADSNLKVKVPSFRATKDISEPIDLVEEIGRSYGYDNIPESAPLAPVLPIKRDKIQDGLSLAKDIMSAGFGYDEVYNYSFISANSIDDLKLKGEHLWANNPLNKDQSHLRTKLIPHILKNIVDNSRHLDKFKLFEVGTTYIPMPNSIALQRLHLCAALRVDSAISDINFYKVRDTAVELISRLGRNVVVKPSLNIPEYAYPSRCADLVDGSEVLAQIFNLHPAVAQSMGITGDVVIMEVALQSVIEGSKLQFNFTPLSKYPTVPFDVGVVASEETLATDIFDVIYKSAKGFVQDITVFDVYRGEQVGEGKKSLACKIVLGSAKGTMAPKHIEKTQNNIMNKLQENGYGIR